MKLELTETLIKHILAVILIVAALSIALRAYQSYLGVKNAELLRGVQMEGDTK